jgi:hypothetical protein
MKRRLKFTLFETNRLEDDLWEVYTEWHWDNGTHTVKDVSHHSSKREAEEQRLINKYKSLEK